MDEQPPVDPLTALVALARTDRLRDELAEVSAGRVQFNVTAPSFVHEYARRHNDAIRAGNGRCCVHLPEGSLLGTPHLQAVWAPGWVVCLQCTDALFLGVDAIANWTCDSCGLYLQDQIASSWFQAGTMLLCMGLCRACRRGLEEGTLP